MDKIPLKSIKAFSQEVGVPRNDIMLILNLYKLPCVRMRGPGTGRGLTAAVQQRVLEILVVGRTPGPVLDQDEVLAALEASGGEGASDWERRVGLDLGTPAGLLAVPEGMSV